MSVSSVSTAYLGTALLPAIYSADSELTNLETEATTGEHANLGLELGEQSGYELSLRNTDDLLQTITTTNALANGRLSTVSNALSEITNTAQSTLQSLVAFTSDTAAGTSLTATGDEALQGLVSLSNSSYGDDYVFGGTDTSEQPMSSLTPSSASQSALLTAFDDYFGFSLDSASAANVTTSQMQSFLTGPFAQEFQGTNWTTNWSSASSDDSISEIAPGQTASTTSTINNTAFEDLAQGYAMLAVFGGSQLSEGARNALVTQATNVITAGSNAITGMGVTVGLAQAAIKTADDDMTAQMTFLQKQLNSLDGVDENTIATQLNTLTTQIESAYQITAQLQKLSLAQYLPT